MNAITSEIRRAIASGMDVEIRANRSVHGGFDVVVKRGDGEIWSGIVKDGLGDGGVATAIHRGVDALNA